VFQQHEYRLPALDVGKKYAGLAPAFLLHRNLPVYAEYRHLRLVCQPTNAHVDHAIWEWANNWIYFAGSESPGVSHSPESVDFVLPLMVLTLRAELFVTTIVADPIAGKKAVIRGAGKMRCEPV
jgi:hypothetical protein